MKQSKAKPDEKLRRLREGYGLASARYDVNLYQKRMMLMIADAAQAKIYGEKNVVGKAYMVSENDFPEIAVPIHEILQARPNETGSRLLKKSAEEMVRRIIKYEDASGWVVFAPVVTVRYPKGSSHIYIQVHERFWRAILDFKKGYRRIDVQCAIALKSVYAIRFYELMSGRQNPITYSIQELKAMFGLEKKYTQINDFVRRVLEPAKSELDRSAQYSFTYEPVKECRKITGFTFRPVHYEDREPAAAEERFLQGQLSMGWDIPDYHVRQYLRQDMGFTDVEIKNNIRVFARATRLLPDCLRMLETLQGKSRGKRNPKGWIIRALEGKVADTLKTLGVVDAEGPLRK